MFLETGTAEINRAVFDRFSLLHALSGVALALLGVSPVVTASILIGWEVVENTLKDNFPQAFPHPSHDSLGNALGDIAAGGAGYALALNLMKLRK